MERAGAIGCALSTLSCGRSSGRYRPVSNSAAVSARLLDLLLPLKAGSATLARRCVGMCHTGHPHVGNPQIIVPESIGIFPQIGHSWKIPQSPGVFRFAKHEQRHEEHPAPSASLMVESASPLPASLQLYATSMASYSGQMLSSSTYSASI